MPNGSEVAARLRKERKGGIPWMVILDAQGKELVTSDGPKGNVGCPVRDHERAFFMVMLAKTRQHSSDEDLAAIKKALDAFAKPINDARRR